MLLEIRGRRVHVTHILCPPFEAGPRLDPDWRKLEIKSHEQLHQLELMKSCGRSVARSIARFKRRGTNLRITFREDGAATRAPEEGA